ncbi:MAG: cupin domain-containing protein [Lachnospiraceae bacterium]|jgi:mannose-6-phosphate isomerase-like protein (cupin superfamily)|nr:cupin domain-containing protein [Lachnospiraceae bacterium]
MKTVVMEEAYGGKGNVVLKHLLDEKQLNGKCGLYAEVTIAPGCSLGYHEHHHESETYFIIKGQGNYNDNGSIRPVKAGDVTFTPDGCGHGIENTGDEDLVFMALIILD